MSSVSSRTADRPLKGHGPGHVIRFRILHPLNFSGTAEERIVNFVHGLAREVLVLRLQIETQVGVVKVM